jgi:hypothetical protein
MSKIIQITTFNNIPDQFFGLGGEWIPVFSFDTLTKYYNDSKEK